VGFPSGDGRWRRICGVRPSPEAEDGVNITITLDGAELERLIRGAVRDELRRVAADALLDVEGAATLLALTPHAVRALVKRGEIPVLRLPGNGRLRFDGQALLEWAKSE
jgi:excisionase family DNA binding protein